LRSSSKHFCIRTFTLALPPKTAAVLFVCHKEALYQRDRSIA
jgi:hypothetical protein